MKLHPRQCNKTVDASVDAAAPSAFATTVDMRGDVLDGGDA